ncbi:serine/threonine-protein kinase [Mesobacillus selenatarsenatis]|uniref:Serine/threonine protein kinase n=1 Tax=Mesobacillus selenatarsenatis (strain DSM 18680 / JCM 14380 / FERM P-15431 / SF-1) TaxID=1321606 RepID=A0A0A8WZ57_MESS1|nr:serine/threonine-protein kinase [Mesobacillus selenatarsenatis]GAM12037.1 serine/threonine protein kinase [Mesobacillus selenatarsenatis SF-1]
MNNLSYTKNHDFRLLEKLHENNGSSFWKAMDLAENRIVGIKRLARSSAPIKDLQAEADNLKRASQFSRNVPIVYQTYMDRNYFYTIMEFFDGAVLLRKMMEQPIVLRNALSMTIKLCETLRPFHENGFFHRDLKPENIFINKKTKDVFLIDFNLSSAKPFVGEGTRNYQSPEQREANGRVDYSRTDIFSIGIILYELVTGKVPEPDKDYYRDRFKIKWEMFTPPREHNPDLPVTIEKIILKCLAYNPAERYRLVNDVARELNRAMRAERL